MILSSFVSLLPVRAHPIDGASPAAVLAANLAREKDFAGLSVVNTKGETIYSLADKRGIDTGLREALSTGEESFAFSRDGGVLYRYAPIRDSQEIVGAARLALSLAGENQRLNRSQQIFLAYFILDFFLLLALGSFLLSRIVVVPIRKLLAATERISAGDYGHSVPVPGGAEIAELAESFNEMVAALRSKREEAEEYMKSLEKANLELEAAREETIRSEKMASIGLLAAGTAHEIGTPLAAIIGYAGILREELADDETKADYLRRIEHDASRIDRIVRDLLNYARPTAAQYENVNVDALLRETLDMMERQGIFKRIETSLDVETGIPLICVDRSQLMQVLINLMVNARDAMPQGGEIMVRAYTGDLRMDPAKTPHQQPFTIMGRRKEDFQGAFRSSFLSGRSLANCVKIEIYDNGTGIDEHNIGKIFDPFFTTKEPGKGTGLGLSISARIIDSFGGRITVESAKGEGARFIIWLPAAGEKCDEHTRANS